MASTTRRRARPAAARRSRCGRSCASRKTAGRCAAYAAASPGGHEHRDVVEAQRLVPPAASSPDRARHGLAARAGRSRARGRRGSRRRRAAGAVGRVARGLAAAARRSAGWWSSVAAGRLAAGRRSGRRGRSRRCALSARTCSRPGRPQRWSGAGSRRSTIFPEALARAERVDDDLGRAPEALEELVEGARHVREAEDVHRARQERGARLERRHGLVQRDDARRRARGRARLRRTSRARGAAATRSVSAWLSGRAPRPRSQRRQHVAARVRVLLEEPAQRAPRAARAARRSRRRRSPPAAQVRAHRGELGLGDERRRRGAARSAIASSAAASATRAPDAVRRPRPRSA